MHIETADLKLKHAAVVGCFRELHRVKFLFLFVCVDVKIDLKFEEISLRMEI